MGGYQKTQKEQKAINSKIKKFNKNTKRYNKWNAEFNHAQALKPLSSVLDDIKIKGVGKDFEKRRQNFIMDIVQDSTIAPDQQNMFSRIVGSTMPKIPFLRKYFKKNQEHFTLPDITELFLLPIAIQQQNAKIFSEDLMKEFNQLKEKNLLEENPPSLKQKGKLSSLV